MVTGKTIGAIFTQQWLREMPSAFNPPSCIYIKTNYILLYVGMLIAQLSNFYNVRDYL